MSLARLYYIHSLLSAEGRKELNLEVENIYLELVNNNNFIVKVQQALLDLTTKEAADVTNLLALIASGNTDTLNTVKKLISDFLAAKPSNFDEVVAARLGEKTLYDLNQKIKTKLDNTDSFQQVKLTDDKGYSISLADASDLNLLTKPGFYNGSNLKNSPIGGYLYIQVYSYVDVNYACMQIAYSLNNVAENSPYIRKKVNGNWTEWKKLGLAGAYDDIKQEVLNVKSTHASLDAAIRSMIPYNSRYLCIQR